jgi:hypothetical protein
MNGTPNNRIATAQVEALAYQLIQRQSDGEQILAALRVIGLQRNLEIISQEPPKVLDSTIVSSRPHNITNRSENAQPTSVV